MTPVPGGWATPSAVVGVVLFRALAAGAASVVDGSSEGGLTASAATAESGGGVVSGMMAVLPVVALAVVGGAPISLEFAPF
jgi:hypothetical protein